MVHSESDSAPASLTNHPTSLRSPLIHQSDLHRDCLADTDFADQFRCRQEAEIELSWKDQW